MANQPTVTIERWFTEGWKLYKRHPVTFFFASCVSALICIPPGFSVFRRPTVCGFIWYGVEINAWREAADS